MPRTWHDWLAINNVEDQEKRTLYRETVADKKPYFMRYIYPSLTKQYNEYIRNTHRNALREFGVTVAEMQATPYRELTERQQDFLWRYQRGMPVGTGPCVMNKICERIEEEFDGFVGKAVAASTFDYTIMKSSATYTPAQFRAIANLYDEYNKQLKNYVVLSKEEHEDSFVRAVTLSDLADDFKRRGLEVCSNSKVLCNIVLDLCYKKSSTKKFAWDMCIGDIIENLLEKNGNIITYPTADPDGDIVYCGTKYRITSSPCEIGVTNDEYCIE